MVHIIGICGQSSSGKTTFMTKFVEKLVNDGYKVGFLSGDWFYKTKPANVTDYNYDTPSAFDFQPLITAISGNKVVSLPEYDYVHHCSIPNVHTYDPAVDFVVVEGIMLYNDETLRHLINTKIFVHTDLDACLARRILRDIKERGRSVEGVIKQWFETVKPGYEDFIYPTMKYADYIFNNTKDSICQNICRDDKLSRLFESLRKYCASPPLGI
jgi:uridine kinase